MKDVFNRLLEILHWVLFVCFVGSVGLLIKLLFDVHPDFSRIHENVFWMAVISVAVGYIGPALLRYICQGRWIWFPWLK